MSGPACDAGAVATADDAAGGPPSAPDPIADDDLVELARTLAGLRHELSAAGVVISSDVDVDPDQRFGPWQAVLDAIRAGVTSLDVADAGTLLERSLPVAGALEAVLPVAEEAAARAGRSNALDEAVAAAVEDAAALADQVVVGDAAFAVTVESFFAGTLAATYATWVVRDLLAGDEAVAGTGLVDGVLRPLAALHRLSTTGAAAAVLDVAEVLPAETWAALATGQRERPEDEAAAAVRVRAAAAVAGLGGAEVLAVAALAPPDVDPTDVAGAALVIGDAAVAAAAEQAEVADAALRRLASATWRACS